MKSAENTGLRHKAFQVAWRLAILVLPWQTRLFWDAQLAGWPWEQGRISVYLSWLPLLGAIILGLFQPKRALPTDLRRNFFWLFAALGACTVIASPTPVTAAIQWWVQVTLLATFLITLWRTQVPIRKFAFWFLVSLAPHALLAVVQFATQTVWASKWLGMAAQNPADLGVSVVQTATTRFLRAYGGFPHPNILGGWMAVGLLTTVGFLSPARAGERSQTYVWGIEGLFTLALFCSFSRSAWLAAAVGLVMCAFLSLRAKSDGARQSPVRCIHGGESSRATADCHVASEAPRNDRKRWFLIFAIPIILFTTLAIVYRDLVLTRMDVSASRLEQKSVATRIQTLKDGIEIYRAVPLFGTGPNSELPVLAALKDLSAASAPLEPPHMVWLLILVDFGTVGALFIFGFGLFLLRRILEKWQNLSPSDRSLFIALVSCQLMLCSLDHYPWSLWSGQALSSMALFMIFHVLTHHESPSDDA